MGRMRLHLASPIDAGAIEHLSQRFDVTTSRDQEGLEAGIRAASVLGFRSGIQVHREALESAGDLQLLVRAGSGLDNVDIETVRSRKLRLVRVPGPGAQSVAELTLGLMLSVARNIALADRSLREAHWPKYELTGSLITNKTLGIVGVGSIGSRVARLGSAIGMRVLGCVGNGDTSSADRYLGETRIEWRPCHEVVSTADIVSVHVPLQDSTRGMVDERFLASMKPGAIFVNTSRGGVVEEQALVAALESGHLGGAALDVHRSEGEGVVSPLARFPNVVLTPHIGAMAADSQAQIGVRVIELVEAHFDGRLDEVASFEELVV